MQLCNFFNFKTSINSTAQKSTNKTPKPKDYREWEKIEKSLEKELEENENEAKAKANKSDVLKVTEEKTAINSGPKSSKSLIQELNQKVETQRNYLSLFKYFLKTDF